MSLKNKNEDWNQDAPSLAGMDVTNPFTVPENYFSDLTEHLQARVGIEALTGGKHQNDFHVPDNYFETLEEQILSSVRAEEFKERISTEAFTVPEGYFTDLQDRIISRTLEAGNDNKEPIIRRLIPGWIKYAAAACITAIIATGVFLNTKTTDNNVAAEVEFSQIPQTEIVAYLQAYNNTGDVDLIAEHLQSTDDLSDLDMELSEQEIQQYLESTL
ncbi:hypothetical protein [Desertivirga xinjiangensis]|uniref:hypothetical protein n=1 Tax=Desertivirga xinjiangensis TaxID=539206 RepID=UPI00210B1F79|nr:hypothetical protein [Pedobacter xinjiangensis]